MDSGITCAGDFGVVQESLRCYYPINAGIVNLALCLNSTVLRQFVWPLTSQSMWSHVQMWTCVEDAPLEVYPHSKTAS